MKLLIAVQWVLLSLGASLPSYAATTAQDKIFPSVPGELVVKLSAEPNQKNGFTFEKVARDLQGSLGLKSTIRVRHLLTTERFAVLKMSEASLKAASAVLASDSRVAYAEPNYLYHLVGVNDANEVTPNDEQYGALWGLKNTGQTDAAGQIGIAGSDIHVAPIWAEGITGSKKVTVAVIDTGIDYNHSDLKDNVDATRGYNFADNTPDAKDDHNHGSHCAGTIGGLANNGIGVVGVNWNVTIIPVKFLNSAGSGTLDAAVQSIQWATKQKVNIMSNSWGGGPYTQALYDVIAEARDQGIAFIAAAGNEASNNDGQASYPANYELPNIISVAATDNRDQLASFSNYGRNTVHVAAPGVKILSTAKDGGYAVFSGTSMATPHVAGIAALMLSANPSLTYAQIKDILIRSSDKVRGLSRKVVAKGRVNAYNAIHEIFPADNSPAESAWQDVEYSVESPHPYENSKTYNYAFAVPNARYVRVVFDSIDTESGYDVVSVKNAQDQDVENLSGTLNHYASDYIEGASGSIVFKTDNSVNKTGFKVAKLQAIF
jgi:thermitase